MEDPCACIEKLYEHYNKQFQGGIQFTNTVQMVDRSTGEISDKPPLLRFKYYALGKDNKPTKKIKSSYITPNYCQFCGKHY